MFLRAHQRGSIFSVRDLMGMISTPKRDAASFTSSESPVCPNLTSTFLTGSSKSFSAFT